MRARMSPIKAAASMCAAVLSLTATTTALAQSTEAPSQRVVVKWKKQLPANAQPALAAARALIDTQTRYGVALTTLRTMGSGADVIRLDNRLDAAQFNDLIATLARNPAVEYVHEDRLLQPLFTPNDPLYPQQWHYYEPTGGLNLPTAWDLSTGVGINVAVIDTGYRPHVDLAANIVGGYDFISDPTVAVDGNGRDSDATDPGDGGCPTAPGNSSWHGTHVGGTIAAVTNNAVGVAGVAFGAKVVPVRALGRCGGFASDIADAITWASGGAVAGVPANPNPARVLNLSLGGGGPCDATTQAAINGALARKSVVVVAAGNSNTNAINAVPANCSGVVTVAATNRSGGRAFYSNTGAVVDVAAPGGAQAFANDPNGVLSTLNAGAITPGADNYVFYQGTSMATPHVAGTAALILSRNGTLTSDQVEALLRNTTRTFPAACVLCGTGIVNAFSAVNNAVGAPPATLNILSNAVPVAGVAEGTSGERRFTIVVPAGRPSATFQISGGTGDADLYVSFNAPPTTTSFSCRPFLGGNSENCTFTSPPAGTYHVLVRGFSAYTGVSVVASF